MNNEEEVLLQSVRWLAERGFHGKAIGKITGLSCGQVYYRNKKLGISIRAYRDGLSKPAREFVIITPCVRENIKAKRGIKYKVDIL